PTPLRPPCVRRYGQSLGRQKILSCSSPLEINHDLHYEKYPAAPARRSISKCGGITNKVSSMPFIYQDFTEQSLPKHCLARACRYFFYNKQEQASICNDSTGARPRGMRSP